MATKKKVTKKKTTKKRAVKPKGRPTKRTPARRAKFLDLLRLGTNVTDAAKLAGLCRDSWYLWRSQDEEFAKDWEEAAAAGELVQLHEAEEELRRRAIEGWDEPVFQGGELVGMKRKFSDGLLAMRLKRLDRRYIDRMAVTDADGGPITVVVQKPE